MKIPTFWLWIAMAFCVVCAGDVFAGTGRYPIDPAAVNHASSYTTYGDGTRSSGVDSAEGVRVLKVDDAVDENNVYQLQMPSDYTGGGAACTLKFSYKTETDTGDIEPEVFIMAVSAGEDWDVASFDTVNTATETVPGTAGRKSLMSVTLSNMDGAEPGDTIIAVFSRNIDGANDTAADEMDVGDMILEYPN